MKKVIFVDWHKTLSYDDFWEHLKSPDHPRHKYFKPLNECLFADSYQLTSSWMCGQATMEAVMEKVSRKTSIPLEIVMQELIFSLENTKFCLPNIKELVQSVQATGKKVVVATDNMDTFNRYTAPALKMDKIFDGVINSYDVGCLKDDPDPADKILFFEDYLDKNNFTYSDAVLLDNSPDSSGKYKRLGFERKLIDSPETLEAILKSYR